jgi:hypothetical protein
MMHMKIKGLFLSLPLESLSLEWISELTRTPKDIVQLELEILLKAGFIVGKRKFKLKNVPQHIKDIPKKK